MKKYSKIVFIAAFIFFPTTIFAYSNSIQGKVIDSNTGKALAGSNVEIAGTSIGAAADEQGYFSINNIPPGKYILRITHIGYKPVEKSVIVSYNERVSLTIFLASVVIEGQSIIVTARSDANQAIERETPISFTKLSAQKLTENYTSGDLPDLIQNVPGVWTSTAGIGESEVSIRGFASDKVQFMINDIPMNDPEDHHIYWSNWAGLSYAAQSVEVQRGPGFSLYGTGDFGGSMHINTIGITSKPEKSFRFSVGRFNRMGIQSGPNTGMYINPLNGELEPVENPINYTYAARFCTGPKYNGLLNLSFYFEYKTGDSYILGTTYDGFTLGLDAESIFDKHKILFSFIVSPQAHNQAFALQDIHLLKSLGREYNRKDHAWQENYYVKPLCTVKHVWQISEQKNLVNNLFFTFGKGADQSLNNDVFDVESGIVDFQPCTRGKDAQAFGYHAQYLYNNYGLLTTDFIPAEGGSASRGGSPSFFKGIEVYNEFGIGINFFADQHSHSFQNRRRRDHWQFGLISYMSDTINEKFSMDYGIESRIWHGNRTSEAWFLQISNVDAQDRQVWAPLGIHNYTSKIQSIYDYDTRVYNFSIFGRIKWKPKPSLTVQGGSQLFYTHSQVIENPIPLLDFGTWEFFHVAKRTTADLKGDRKYGWCNDYLRKYFYVTPWVGINHNLTAKLNLFTRLAISKKEPAILDWYDFSRGPLFQKKYYPESEEARSITPESVTSFEFGIGYQERDLRLNLGYYYTMFKNKIESVIDINDRRTTMNAGNALFQGVECEMNWRFNNFDFATAITLARNRWKKMNVKEIFDSDASDVEGKVVPFAPEKMLTSSIGYTLNASPSAQIRFNFRVNYWDDYYGTYTNQWIKTIDYIGADNLPYRKGIVYSAKLPHFLELSSQLSFTKKTDKIDFTFRIQANNMLNRADNFMRAQYTVDYTRTDEQAGRYNWYVLQAPLFNVFFTTELGIH